MQQPLHHKARIEALRKKREREEARIKKASKTFYKLTAGECDKILEKK